MMKRKFGYSVVMNHELGEPAVEQQMIDNVTISWNPDDNRFYVVRNGETAGTFKEMRNAAFTANKLLEK